MPSKRQWKFLILLLTFLTAGPNLFSADRVEWEPVDGADHYLIEIRRDGNLVLETRSEEAGLPLFLPPGDYEFQVRVMNAFGKTSSESEWSPLRIIEPVIPFIIDMAPRSIHEGANPQFRVRLSGYVPASGDEDGSLFILRNEEGKAMDLDVTDAGTVRAADGAAESPAPDSSREATEPSSSGVTWREITLRSRRKEPDSGAWTLVMTNPDGRENIMNEALVVMERLRPRVRGTSPRELPDGGVHTPATVEIDGLEDDAVVTFDGPSDIPATLLNRPRPDKLEYSFNLAGAELGWYSISVENPSGGTDTKDKAFKVVPRPLTEEEIAALNALKIDEREPRDESEHPRSLFLGWGFTFPVGAAADACDNGYAGLSLGFAREFSNDLFRKLRFTRGLAWEAAFTWSSGETTHPLVDINLNHYRLLLGFRYITPFDFPVNLLLRSSAGLDWSIYTSPDYGREEYTGLGYELRDLDSLDFAMRFGAGLRVDIGRRFFVDAVCDMSSTFYLSRTSWTIEPRLEGGWKW